MMTDLVRKDSIEEICGHRDRALALYEQAREALIQARQAHARACIGKAYISSYDPRDFFYGLEHVSDYQKVTRRMVDRDMWQSFIVNTPIGSLMDTQERKAFEDILKRDDFPEVSPDNVEQTLRRLSGEAGMIFRRGLVNAFSKLCRDYKSNDGFKIGGRIVLTSVVIYDPKYSWMRGGYRMSEDLKDVDRVMHVLDGKPAPEYQQGITAALRAAISAYRSGGSMECETEYWRLKFHKNGNGHLYPKRADLVAKANRLIAEDFGEVLGAANHVAKKTPQPRADRSTLDAGWFPTPAAIVARMMDAAALEHCHKALEPSAGTGALAVPMSETGASLTCYEINANRAAELRIVLRGTSAQVVAGDFLDSPDAARFDRIVMNPPFAQQQDIMHVLAAYRRLAPGGRLVAIMSPAVTYSSTDAATEARALIAEHGTIDRLPSGSFKLSGTSVETMIVTVDKPF